MRELPEVSVSGVFQAFDLELFASVDGEAVDYLNDSGVGKLHAFITDRDGETLELEADHRRHAEVENALRDLKYGVGLNHMPSARFAANGAWLAGQVMAHNLARWTARIGLGERTVITKTLRRRVFALVGRITRSARRLTLHLPRRWPWETQFSRALARLQAIPFRPDGQPATDSTSPQSWKLVYGDEASADDIAVKAESFVWEGYAQQVRDRFLAEYSAAKELPIPAGYDFRPNKKDLAQPLLMQRHALNWTRLSCYKFVAHQVRLWLFVLAYNLGNFMRRLVLPEDMKHWTLTSLQTRLIKTGGRLVLYARRLVFQLAEVLVTREMLTGILEPISWLRLAPG